MNTLVEISARKVDRSIAEMVSVHKQTLPPRKSAFQPLTRILSHKDDERLGPISRYIE